MYILRTSSHSAWLEECVFICVWGGGQGRGMETRQTHVRLGGRQRPNHPEH